MTYETIKYEQDGPVGILTLNRPKCLNAVNFAMRDEVRDFFKQRMEDNETRVIVMTGEGRGFCSGLDIKDPSILNPPGGLSPKPAYELQKGYSDIILFMRTCPQPIIAAVNGPAAGAGLSFAMASDVRLAAPEAKFSAAYINIGVGGADMGSSWLLPRLVGVGNAARYILTGDYFDAQEALRIGLVQDVVEKDKLMDEALAMAKNMATKSPLGLRLTKEVINKNAGGMSLEEAIMLEDRNQAMCISELVSQTQGNK